MAIVGAFIICVLVWGSTWYAIELQLGQVAVEWSLAYRFGLASLGTFILCLSLKKKLRFSRRQHLWFALLGTTMFSGNYLLVYMGTAHLTSGLVAVLFSLMAFFNILFARLFLKQKTDGTLLLGVLLGISGLILIFWPEMTSGTADIRSMITGILLVTIATAIASAGNTVAGNSIIRSIPILSANAWGMAYGALFIALFALVRGIPPSLDDRASYYLALVHLAFLGTLLAFSVYLWLLDKVGVGRAGYTAVLVPLVALTISTIFEGYVWTLPAATGLMMTLGGIVLVLRQRTKEAR